MSFETTRRDRRSWMVALGTGLFAGCWSHQPPGRSPAAEDDPRRADRARAQEAAVEQAGKRTSEKE
ncbi:hypothetical protein Pan216_42100 [Planctomycetes bacterium Pan216]|uniref:Lipoprotein n=1 Tax=Kolteria novifilia TaxID=2527975 RepID=A0A518B8Q7_9BACT|nr:hypothetical protein Pan216_42100 [Planctomycetes bacterium Pan216]